MKDGKILLFLKVIFNASGRPNLAPIGSNNIWRYLRRTTLGLNLNVRLNKKLKRMLGKIFYDLYY